MKIYVDASIHSKGTNIGFYNEESGYQLRMPIRAKNTQRAETTACLLALKKYKNKAIVHTDCVGAMQTIKLKYPKFKDNIVWIPRNENRIADKLSKYVEGQKNIPVVVTEKNTPIATEKNNILNLRLYIFTQSFEKKVKLYMNLAITEWEKDFIKAVEKQYVAFHATGNGAFKYNGKFSCNNRLVALIKNTNSKGQLGSGFNTYLKSRGEKNVGTNLNPHDFNQLIDSLVAKKNKTIKKDING
jgi:ribonuclease HI